MLRNHVGDESKSFGFLGQSVYREMDVREGSCKRHGCSMTDVLAQPSHTLNQHLLAKAGQEGNHGGQSSSGCCRWCMASTSQGEERLAADGQGSPSLAVHCVAAHRASTCDTNQASPEKLHLLSVRNKEFHNLTPSSPPGHSNAKMALDLFKFELENGSFKLPPDMSNMTESGVYLRDSPLTYSI